MDITLLPTKKSSVTKPGIGYVFVEIPPAISSIKTKSGIELFIDTSFNPERYANVYATVLAVPDKLTSKTMNEDRNKNSFRSTDKDMRLQAGDQVWFHYLTLKNALKNYDRGTYFEENGKRYALLPYSSLFFAIREVKAEPSGENVWINSEFISLNDWLLIEPISKEQHMEKIEKFGNIIVDDTYQSPSGLVLTTDQPFKSSEGIVRSCPPDCGIEVGETIIFEKESDVPVEYDLCKTLDKPYWRMKLEDIVAKRKGMGVEIMRDYTLIIRDDPEAVTEFDIFPEPSQTGIVVKTGPEVSEDLKGQKVFFAKGLYTEFPAGENVNGLLVKQEYIWMKTGYSKVRFK